MFVITRGKCFEWGWKSTLAMAWRGAHGAMAPARAGCVHMTCNVIVGAGYNKAASSHQETSGIFFTVPSPKLAFPRDAEDLHQTPSSKEVKRYCIH